MQALIDFIIRNLLAMWPVSRINEWESGILVRAGRITRELGPGLHFRWPFLDIVRTWPSNEVGLDLETAAVTTQDGHGVAISANIGYRVTSLSAMWRGLWNTEGTLRKVALGIIATECAGMTWVHLSSSRVAVETQLREELNRQVGAWGVVVVRVHLTDLVAARSHRHYMDAPAK